jgi:cysteine-rich repeat protein
MPTSSSKIVSALWFLWYGFKLIVLTVFDLLAAFVSLLYTLFFSTQGYLLISSLIMGGIGFALIEHQVAIVRTFSHGWCLFQPFVLPVLNAITELVPSAELFICLWNIGVGAMRELASVAINIAINCSDSQSWLNALFQLGHFGLALLSALLGLLMNPFEGTITIWSADPTTITPWSEFTKLLNFTEVQFACQCEGLSPIFNFGISIIDDQNLGQAVDTAVNTFVAAGQALINVLLKFMFPDFSVAFDFLILTLYHVGDWLDDVIQKFIQLFIPSNQIAPNLFLGCTVSRFVSTFVQAGAILVNGFSNWANSNTGSLVDLIKNLTVADYVGRVNDTGTCVAESVGALDVCLGDAAGAVIKTYGALVQFAANIIQLGVFEFAPVSENFFSIWGQSTYDDPLTFHVIPCLVPPCQHAPAQNQTGLVCFISHVFGGGPCAKAFADLASAVGQLFGTIFLIADYILNLDFTTIQFVGNPLDSTNRATFTEIVLSIILIPVNRVVNVGDYTGHFFECIPTLFDFGEGIVTMFAMIDFQLDNIFELILTTLELLAQIAIWFLSVIGASPFGNTEGTELTTVFGIFTDWFRQILDLVVDFLKGFVDYAIFPEFPTFFGQNSLLDSVNPGTAKFTECFVSIGDCLCGLTKNSIGKICFGELGCLAHWWPSCGTIFTTPGTGTATARRKRDAIYGTTNGSYYVDGHDPIWFFWAVNFNNTVCGPVFNHWYENPPADDMSVGEADGMELLNCVNMVIMSATVAENFEEVPNTFFMDPNAMKKSGHGMAAGLDVVASVAWSNTLLMFADPSELRGMPDANTKYFDYATELRRRGVNDTIAVNTLVSSVNALSNLTRAIKNYTLAGANSVFKNATAYGVAQETTILAARTVNWVTALSGAIVNMVYEGRRVKIGTKFYNAGISLAMGYFSRVTDGQSSTRQTQMEEPRKRYIYPHQRPVGWKQSGPPPPSPINNPDLYANVTRLMEQGIWPVPITPVIMLKQKMITIRRAFGEYMAHLTGAPTIMPLKDEMGQPVTLEVDIPNSCTKILTKCKTVTNGLCNGSISTGTGLTTFWRPNPSISGLGCQFKNVECTGDPIFVDHFTTCNQFFGAVIVAGLCGPEINQTVIDFYYDLQHCNDVVNEVIGTPPPLRIFTTPGLFTCFNTFPNPPYDVFPNSQQSDLGTICLPSDGCTNCPTNQVLPGFTCQLGDTWVSNEEYMIRRCISKFTKGPRLPQEPHNVTFWEVLIVNISKGLHVTRSHCGNGRLETNYTVVYRNPSTKIVTNFTGGEECDPPLSTTIQVIAGINTTVTCGPACQFGRCGNGVLDPGECCDTGAQVNTQLCTANCKCIVCGNGNIDPGETCDDGNQLAYDGCSERCQVEICPVIRYSGNIPAGQPYSICPPNTFPNSSINHKASGPHMCFPINLVYSVLVHCNPKIPLLWTYNNFACTGNQPHPVQITGNCSTQGAVCVGNVYIADGTQCISPVQLGTDFSCTENCSFCGDGIVGPGEQCDDGTLFPTGIPSQDICIECKFACTCNANPTVRCAGICAGGGNNGNQCNPRDPFGLNTTQCNNGFCLTTECAGDGVIQGREICDSTDTNPLNGSSSATYANGSFVVGTGPCINGWPSHCQCQPGRPCMGECISYDLLGGNLLSMAQDDERTFRSFSLQYEWIGSTLTSQVIGASVPCDVSQGAFACPVEGQFCLPKYCCGDGNSKIFGDASGKDICETGVDPLCTSPTCNMVDNTTGYLRYLGKSSRYQTSIGGSGLHSITTTAAPYNVLLLGRRDLCTGIFPSDYIDICQPGAFATGGERDWVVPCSEFTNCPVISPPQKCISDPKPVPRKSPNFNARIGMCFDQFGIAIRPALYCNRNLHSSCDHLGLTGSVCVAEACCGAGMVDIVGLDNIAFPGLFGPFWDPTGNSYFELNSTGGYVGDPTCNYETTVPSVKSCTCQPNSACLGQCTFGSLATDLFCDPVQPINSPWCPVGTNALYECIPIRCCNDGIQEPTSFYDGLPFNVELTTVNEVFNTDVRSLFNALAPWNLIFFEPGTNLQTFSRYPTPAPPSITIGGETCDALCPPGSDCGIGNSIYPKIWTQCVVAGGNANTHGGIFAPQTGICINPVTGASSGQECNLYHAISFGTGFDCGGNPGEECWFQSCCGDGIVQRFELCDDGFANILGPCNATCGRPIPEFPFSSRKRQAPLVELAANDTRNILYLDELGQLELTINFTLPPQLNFSNIINDTLSTFIFNATDFVFGRLGFATNSSNFLDQVETFFENTDSSPYTPVDKQGFFFWLRFLISCPQPLATDCENGVPVQGVGTIAAIQTLVPIFFWIFVIVGVAGIWIGGVPTSVLLMLTSLFGAQIFTAYAYHYPLYCFPMITECAPQAIQNLTQTLNSTFPPFWDDLVISGDPATCTVNVFNCKDLGLLNGFDYFIALMQKWFPSFMSTFFNSMLATVFSVIPIIGPSITRGSARFETSETMDECLGLISVFAIAQIFALGSLLYILGSLLLNILSNLLGRLGDTGIAGIQMLRNYEGESDIQLVVW